MKILLGAVSALALMTAAAQAQVFNFSPASGGLDGDFGDGIFADVLAGDFANPDTGAGVWFDAFHFATADDPNPLGGDGGADGVVGSAGGSENVATHIQAGVGNTGLIYQDSGNVFPDNGAVLLQVGNDNAGMILQYNDWNDAAAVQDGDGNSIVINQSLQSTFDLGPGMENSGRSDHAAVAFQRGDENIGLIDQGGNNNAAALLAYGDGNQQFIIQDSYAGPDVPQNMAITAAVGNNNIAFINQNTDEGFGPFGGMIELIDETYGTGLTSDTIDVDADAEDISDGPLHVPLNPGGLDTGSNKAGIFQTGEGNRAVTFQNGTGNNSSIIQHDGVTL